VIAPSLALQRTRWLALLSCLGLIVLGLAWELVLAPTGRGTLAIKVLPLVAALPGLWRWRLYTCRWLSLVVWLYTTEGLVRVWSDVGIGRGLALIEVILSLLLFAACAAQVRWRLRAGRQAEAQAQAHLDAKLNAGLSAGLNTADAPARS
jgi:uncharacterized membrane protein